MRATTVALWYFGLALGVSGCPVAAELENPERFLALAGASGTSATGGTANAGAGGGGPTCAHPLPTVEDFQARHNCNYRQALGAPMMTPSGYCYKGGCHNSTTKPGGLDLTPDDFLLARLLNVTAKHIITCGTTPCDPATCDKCTMCPTGDLLINTTDVPNSWILKKIDQFVPGTTTATLNINCGDAMPTFNTPGIAAYTAEHKRCLQEFFTELATTPGVWPCTTTPAGGAGGAAGAASGAGGAGGATSGAGGT